MPLSRMRRPRNSGLSDSRRSISNLHRHCRLASWVTLDLNSDSAEFQPGANTLRDQRSGGGADVVAADLGEGEVQLPGVVRVPSGPGVADALDVMRAARAGYMRSVIRLPRQPLPDLYDYMAGLAAMAGALRPGGWLLANRLRPNAMPPELEPSHHGLMRPATSGGVGKQQGVQERWPAVVLTGEAIAADRIGQRLGNVDLEVRAYGQHSRSRRPRRGWGRRPGRSAGPGARWPNCPSTA